MYLDLFFRTLVVTLVPDWVYLPLHLVPQPNHIPPSHTFPSSALSSHSSFIRPSHSFFIRSPQSLFLHPLSPVTLPLSALPSHSSFIRSPQSLFLHPLSPVTLPSSALPSHPAPEDQPSDQCMVTSMVTSVNTLWASNSWSHSWEGGREGGVVRRGRGSTNGRVSPASGN